MNYYCEICDNTKKPKSKNIYLKFLTHDQNDNLIQKITLLKIQSFST